jgi:hypothetical protein
LKPTALGRLKVYPLPDELTHVLPTAGGQHVVVLYGERAGVCGVVKKISGPMCTISLGSDLSDTCSVLTNALHVHGELVATATESGSLSNGSSCSARQPPAPAPISQYFALKAAYEGECWMPASPPGVFTMFEKTLREVLA